MIEHYTERSNKRDHWPPGSYFRPDEYCFQKLYIRLDIQSLFHAIPFGMITTLFTE